MKCDICPRKCSSDRSQGQKGFCGVGDLPVVCRAAPHLWEEPCICGENGSGTVFFAGCNLKCVFCQNAKISRGGEGREYTPSDLADLYLELQAKGVSNINLVTPSPWVNHIKASLDIAWERGLFIPIVYNCGGYESVEAIRSLRGYVGIYMPDFKYMSEELGRKYSFAPDYPEVAKRALYEMVCQRSDAVYDGDGMMVKGVIVRHLILPSHIEDSMRVLEYLHSEYGDSIVISIMSQYTPMPNMLPPLDRRVSEEEYRAVVEYAKSIGIRKAYIQDGESAVESFIPDFVL